MAGDAAGAGTSARNTSRSNLLSRFGGKGTVDRLDTRGEEHVPWNELFYYPGHAYPVCGHIASDTLNEDGLIDLLPGHMLAPATAKLMRLVFFTLRKTQREAWVLLRVVLEADEEDERIVAMQRDLYPGATVHLPSSLYTSRLHQSSSHGTPLPILVPDLRPSPAPASQPSAAVLHLTFGYPATRAEEARRDGVLVGWTRRGWGRVIRNGQPAVSMSEDKGQGIGVEPWRRAMLDALSRNED